MSSERVSRTNPAYAALAYRKAVLHSVVTFLDRQFLSPSGVAARETMFSDEVFQIDGEVPQLDISQYMEGLVTEMEIISLEMAKFEFTRKQKTDEPVTTTKEIQSKQVGGKQGGKAPGQGPRGKNVP